ncbi:MAG: glycosyltransferase [Bacteroidales bacterium]
MKNKDLHILFLTRWYPHKFDSMFGLFVQRHAEVACQIGNVSVIYLHELKDGQKKWTVTNDIENNCHVVRVYYPDVEGVKLLCLPIKAYRFIKAFRMAYRLVVKNIGKPTLTHVNILTRMGILAECLRIFKNIPYVITEHWSRYLPITNTYKGFFRKIATKRVVKKTSAVSTVSKNLENAMKSHKLLNDNYFLLPNVVDFDLFALRHSNEKSDVFRFLHVSCFEDRSKNISGLLKATLKLSEEVSNFELVLVGDGVDFEVIKQQAATMPFKAGTIKFTGLLEGKDLVEEFQKSNALILFSNYENMPVVISEAFACGLPVIATKVGGIPEFVDESNGILVDRGNEEQLKNAMQEIMLNYSKYDSNKIRNQANKIFSQAAVKKSLEKLYSKIN